MWMWLVILGVTVLACGGGLVFLISRFRQFSYTEKYSRGKKWLRNLLAAAPVIAIIVVLKLIFGATNMMVIVIMLTVIWAICAAVSHCAYCVVHRDADSMQQHSLVHRERRSLGKALPSHPRICTYITAAAAFALTFVYFAFAWYFAHSVVETDYTIQTDKAVQPLKVALIADAHMGTTFDGEAWARHLAVIEATNPDVLVIAGDLVDDSTNRAEMEACCEALGSFKAPLGVYYAYGNHDKGYYGSSRGYTYEALEEALTKNGVIILEDETAELTGGYALIGRADASSGIERGMDAEAPGRRDIADLLRDIPQEQYTIVLDHQPNDYEAEAAAGADLVLSGHTHGGQLIPITKVGEWIGANDATYGHEKRENTDFIVTSGISAWEIPFKTGCRSEFVIIRIEPR